MENFFVGFVFGVVFLFAVACLVTWDNDKWKWHDDWERAIDQVKAVEQGLGTQGTTWRLRLMRMLYWLQS